MKNPFKFGTVVSENHFTNRVKELAKVNSILESNNHLILMSPRRFGKTSLIKKATGGLDRPVIFIDMMLINSSTQLGEMLLKKAYALFPRQKIKSRIKDFRIIPTLSLNPVTNEVDVQFSPQVKSSNKEIEDVLDLIDDLGKTSRKPILVFDEFQEIYRIDSQLERQLRSIMQNHKNINYVFLGSLESMIEKMFLGKKSPFYHFGSLMRLDTIDTKDFLAYLINGLSTHSSNAADLSAEILQVTKCHPYYTQQLAYYVWEIIARSKDAKNPVEKAIGELILAQDNSYERLWDTFNTTDRKIMINLALYKLQPLSFEFLQKTENMPASTASTSLLRLSRDGYLHKKNSAYLFEDPFFEKWLLERLRK